MDDALRGQEAGVVREGFSGEVTFEPKDEVVEPWED